MKTAGYEAEYGQSTGGVVNVLTKSGTNDCRGSLFGYFRPTALEGEFEQVQTENGAVNTAGTQTSDAGFTVGGPIVPRPDLLLRRRTTRLGDAGRFTAPAGFPLESLGEVDRNRHINSYCGEGEAVSLATVTGSMPRSSAIRPRATWVRSACPRWSRHRHVGLQRARSTADTTRRSSTTASSVRAGWSRQRSRARRTTWSRRRRSTRSQSPTRPSCQTWSAAASASSRPATRASTCSTRPRSTHIFGGHQIRYGVHYEDIEYNNINQYTGPTFTLSDGQATAPAPASRSSPTRTSGRSTG